MTNTFTSLIARTADALLTVATAADLPSYGVVAGAVRYVEDTGLTYTYDGVAWEAGSGSVVGPVTSTDNAVARFDGTGGATLQDSAVIISDAGAITAPTLTASKALVSDGFKVITSSTTSATEIGYVAGVTSAIQAQIDAKVATTLLGANNGVATLDGGGKIPLAQLPASIFEYKGTWNALTNTPTLSDGTGTAGWLYRVTVAGTQNLGSGAIIFAVGDYVIYNSDGVWEKSDTTDAVLSVNTQTGAVVLGTTDVVTAASVTNAMLAGSIADTKLSTIATAGKVSNSATTATSANTASAIVARDGSGNFTAGTITAALTGNVTGNVSGTSGSTTGNAATVTTNANLTGDVTSVGNATTLTNAPVIAKVLTGYSSGAGTVSATDSILQAIQKLNGNDATNANLTGDVTSVGNATTYAGTVPVAKGGTAVTSVTTAPAATSFAGWDANKNLSAFNHIEGYSTTATAAGTTTLVVGSNFQQFFTGTSTQTVVLPVTSTLVLGQQYQIVNLSTGIVTVQSSGANNIQLHAANSVATYTCILTSGTNAASWSVAYAPLAGAASGAGEKNYIVDASTAANWATSDAAGITVATTTSGLPRANTTKSGILMTGVTGTTAYNYYRFIMDDADAGKKLKIQFDMEPGTAVASDFEVRMYSNTASDYTTGNTRLPLGTDDSTPASLLPALTGTYRTTFDAPATSAKYLELRIKMAASQAHTLVISDVIVGPGVVVQGAAVGPVQAYTPTFVGLGTVTNIDFTWRRVGDKMHICGSWTTGTVTGVTASFSLPNSLTTAAGGGLICGKWARGNAGATVIKQGTVLLVAAGTTVNFSIDDYTTAINPLTAQLGNNAFGNASSYSLEGEVIVPIAEWAGSGTVNIAQNDVEWSSDSGSADVFGPAGSLFPNQAAATGTTTYDFAFPTAPQDSDLYILETQQATGYPWETNVFPFTRGNNSGSTNFYGVRGYWTSATTFRVEFGNQGNTVSSSASSAGATPWSTFFTAGAHFRVRKAKSGAAVGFGKATPASSGLITSYAPTVRSRVLATSADYTILDTDGYDTILVTAASAKTVTLPAVANNTGRRIVVKKVDSGTGSVTVDGNSTELIDASQTKVLFGQYGAITIDCDGSKWHVVSIMDDFTFTPGLTKAAGSGTLGTATVNTARCTRSGNIACIELNIDPITVATNTVQLNFTLPFTAKNTSRSAAVNADAGTVALGRVLLTAASATAGITAVTANSNWSVAAGTSSIYANFSYEISD